MHAVAFPKRDAPAALSRYHPSRRSFIIFRKQNLSYGCVAWSAHKHKTIPNPMPCGDNCGAYINWHMASDYRGGWTARITIFNSRETDFPD
ncbi:hypothetical protein HID58_077079 [Brassica napus]|uniref:COBRA C-terminal domain-containing protein n=1 Tax=Brassica napus TaxID=3708 RepID=A0ABQ7YQY6_BRANA|nr:hypothetical protein HID58_077079 [Brassica napus]